MDRSAVKEIVDTNLRWMKWGLGLRNWTISVEYDSLSQDNANDGSMTVARVVYQNRYRQATVYLDHGRFDDAPEVLRLLRHELLHLVVAPFGDVENVGETFARGKRERKVFGDMYADAMELSLVNLERMLDMLGLTAEKIVERAREEVESWNAPDPTLAEDEGGENGEVDGAVDP